jgi:hypothetical protein
MDFVCLDLGLQHPRHGQRHLAGRAVVPRDPVGNTEDRTQIVGAVAPLPGEPSVVELQPANQRSDVEGGIHGTELQGRSRGLRSVGDVARRLQRTKESLAARVRQRRNRAAKRVQQTVLRHPDRIITRHAIVAHVISDPLHDVVVRLAFYAGGRFRCHLLSLPRLRRDLIGRRSASGRSGGDATAEQARRDRFMFGIRPGYSNTNKQPSDKRH